MGHYNRKATKAEMAHARQVIADAFPALTAVFGSRADYGGHYKHPRVRTISFRLRDDMGRFHCNVVWLQPEWLATLTAGEVVWLVERSNGKHRKKR